MILYGRNPVMEALRGRRSKTLASIWATPRAVREPWLAGREVIASSAAAIEERCGSSAHQGICAEFGPYPYVSDGELLGGAQLGGRDISAMARPPQLILALDQVQDPQNLGSICRSAECAGALGLAIPERRSAHVTPAVCKASAGAVEHLRIARLRNLADFLERAKRAGCWCYGGSPGPGSIPFEEPDYVGRLIVVLGSEGKGLRPRVAAACDELITLPVRGRIDSLGVAAAAAALLYGITRDGASRTSS